MSAYRYTDGDGQVILIPSRWAGDLDDKIAAAADAAGATVLPDLEQTEAPKRKPAEK